MNMNMNMNINAMELKIARAVLDAQQTHTARLASPVDWHKDEFVDSVLRRMTPAQRKEVQRRVNEELERLRP